MTSGSEGLHIAVPLKANKHFDIIHDFTKTIANYICNNNPTDFTTAIRKNKREGRLYIDFLRNSYAQTSIVPFSIRALENAPVATPLDWDELNDTALNAQYYNIETIFKRLETRDDPWQDFGQNAKGIDTAIKTMEALINKEKNELIK
jgi:bifunctional non-homologous end joining protein LigD